MRLHCDLSLSYIMSGFQRLGKLVVSSMLKSSLSALPSTLQSDDSISTPRWVYHWWTSFSFDCWCTKKSLLWRGFKGSLVQHFPCGKWRSFCIRASLPSFLSYISIIFLIVRSIHLLIWFSSWFCRASLFHLYYMLHYKYQKKKKGHFSVIHSLSFFEVL